MYTFSHVGIKCDRSLLAPVNGHKTHFEIGRIQYIIFTCDPGYLIMGESLTRCINGRWSYPTPKCVKKI